VDLNATAYFEKFLVDLSFCTAAGDATRATSREFVVDGHDREVVVQVVRDLGRHWEGPPVRLVLTGPAGGSWTLGDASPPVATRQHRRGRVPAHAVGPARHTPPLDGSGDDAAVATVGVARVVF
jgi:hypothetical protein